MIEKMKFISITGPKDDIDRVVDQYLSRHQIHLENALSELKTVKDLKPYVESNPYTSLVAKAGELLGFLSETDITPAAVSSRGEAERILRDTDVSVEELRQKRAALEERRGKLQASLKTIEPFRELPYNIHSILEFEFVNFRFGRIARDYFEKFEKYVYDNLDTIFYKCHVDEEYVWGVYFVPAALTDKIDAVYSSMHFERFFLPDEYSGTAEESIQALKEEIFSLTKEIQTCSAEIRKIIEASAPKLAGAGNKLSALSENFDVRKLAACTKEGKKMFYILCGWMPEKEAAALEQETADDERLYCIIEEDHSSTFSAPPTKLKNPKLFRPFEMFIRMYGLPAHNEMDPTIFVAITYAFLFGAMFGDVGQGLCLAVGGLLLYRFKKIDLAAIIGYAGIFSTIFGFLYGSVFGFEDVIPALWLHPVSHMTTIPFIGKLNTVFIVAIALGMFIILLTMVFNIINGIRAKDVESTWFDTNGVCGLVFYGAVVLTLVLYMTGNKLPAGIILGIMFGVPLILMGLKEPLSKLVEKKADYMPKQKGMYLIQAFFELFEVLLSYFSNTISFVRIGAFAVSHAAMMEVVLMLAGAENGASPNWAVMILGNIFVCGMEGLIVAIQMLRLEYYELFSRFYKGSGREFLSFSKLSKNKH